jgi:signal recognition particle receptor subunit beta
MATLDRDTGGVVVRIVYDGPALAGKTTSLKALAGSLGRSTFSGDEAQGRTLYLDWMDFEGGLYRGAPIRCQVITVPGQSSLASRRRFLLDAADSVILVVDSRAERLPDASQALAALRRDLGPRDPPVGMVVQANWRDAETAVDLGRLRAELGGGDDVAITESVASVADGTRETFVFAVRLALERVKELERTGTLEAREIEIREGADLLAALKRREEDDEANPPDDARRPAQERSLAPSPPPPPPSRMSLASVASPLRASSAAPAPREHRLPDSRVPLGHVWPPVQGRIWVHEAESDPILFETRSDGEVTIGTAAWRWRTTERDFHSELGSASEALLNRARTLSGCASQLSRPRALVLGDATGGGHRIWQLLARVETLGARVARMAGEGSPREIGACLWRAACAILEADQALARFPRPAGHALDLLAEKDGVVVYAGFVADDVEAPSAPADAPSLEALTPEIAAERLRAEMAYLRRELRVDQRSDLPRVVAGVREAAVARGETVVSEALEALLIGR